MRDAMPFLTKNLLALMDRPKKPWHAVFDLRASSGPNQLVLNIFLF